MDNLIDYFEKEKEAKSVFSVLSFIMSILTLMFVIILFEKTAGPITASEGLYSPPIILVFATEITCFLGGVFTGASFVRKEKSKYFKWIGGILNILIFIFIMGTIIFAKVVG